MILRLERHRTTVRPYDGTCGTKCSQPFRLFFRFFDTLRLLPNFHFLQNPNLIVDRLNLHIILTFSYNSIEIEKQHVEIVAVPEVS